MAPDPPTPTPMPMPMPMPMEGREPTDEEVDAIMRRGPTGAFAVAGVATALVVALYYVFYILVYLPRGAVQ